MKSNTTLQRKEKENYIFVSGDGKKMWIADETYPNPHTKNFIEIYGDKAKRGIASAYGLELWIK